MIILDFVLAGKNLKVFWGQISLWKSVKQFQRLLIKAHIQLANLSTCILQFEKEVDKLLLQGTIPPETFRRWVEEAKHVEHLAHRALQTTHGSCPLDYETLNYLHIRIILLLENSPCRDERKYDKLIRQREVAHGLFSPKMMSIFEEMLDEKSMREKSSKDAMVEGKKPGQLLGIEQDYTADLVKPSSGEIKQAEPIGSQIKILDQDQNLTELLSLQEDVPKSDQAPVGTIITPEGETILSVEDVKEMPASSERKDKQHHGDDILNFSHLAKESAFKNEIEIEELEPLPANLSDECKRDSSDEGMSWSETVQEQHEATQFPETKNSSILATPKITNPDKERNSPLELGKIESISSLSERSIEGENPEPTPTSILPHLYEVEPESERGQTMTKLTMSTESTLLVEVSVVGKLSNFVDIQFEIFHGLSSSEGQNANNEFKHRDVASEADNYRILMREKGVKMEVDQSYALQGDLSSLQLPESSKTPSIKLPEHLIFNQEGARLASAPEDEKWRQAGVMILRDSVFPSLPQQPDCPNLVLLFLQRNRCLINIPDSFFSCMHSLRVVDLSDNRISHLPPTLFRLRELQVLILRNCKLLDELPKDLKELVALEVLDLSGTELNKAPNELGHLTHLRKLQLTFYGTDDESDYVYLPHEVLSHNILSKLQLLEALSIVVHPEDVRWIRNAEAIMQEVGKAKSLCYLEFYFPRVELLKQFTEMSYSWPKISLNKFKFVVGQNVKRFADRVPNDVEIKFNEQKRCLRFVNGEDASQAVKEVLRCVTAFYLDHHQVIRSLSELGITSSKEIKFCVVRECPNIEVIIMDDGDVEPAYPSLEHMGIYYLWKLETISRKPPPRGSFSSLKSLAVHACPILEFILYGSMLEFLHNLEELVVEDCESVKEIIRESDGEVNDNIFALPLKLRKIKLYYLPQLLTFWRKLGANLEDPVLKGDFKALESVTVYSCPNLDLHLLESIAKNVKLLNSETVFQNEDAWTCTEEEEQLHIVPGVSTKKRVMIEAVKLYSEIRE